MKPEIEELLAQYGPAELARLEADWMEVIQDWLPKTAQTNPDYVAKALSGLKPEERLAGLKPEERLALLKLLSQQSKEVDQKD